MAQKVIIPRMGQTMTEGIVAQWYVKDGARVEPGNDIYELEYDKASATIQAKQAGTIRLIAKEGDTVPLGNTVAVILAPGETLESTGIGPDAHIRNAAKDDQVLAEDKRAAQETTEDVRTNRSGDLCKNVTIESVRYKASPMAKKLVIERGLCIDQIIPADGQRITKRDVLKLAEIPVSAQNDLVPLKGMRQTIAKRMTESYFTYPAVTLTSDADMSEILQLKAKLNEALSKDGGKLTVTDFIIDAVAKALKEHPNIITSLEKDMIVYHKAINIGVAVALEDGLVVPVICGADRLGLKQISAQRKRLTDLAKAGQIEGCDMQSGTFTITNLGVEGIDGFTPIINPPQSAILGIGRIVDKPVVCDGRIEIQPRAVLSLTHDHRVIDGVPAARFLSAVVRYIEAPYLFLLD